MNQGRKKGRKKRMSAKLAVRNCRERTSEDNCNSCGGAGEYSAE